jgi:hypothetical protein
MRFLARAVQHVYADLKGAIDSMSRPLHNSSTFIVPEPANAANLSTKPKESREAKPFVIVPASMVVDSDKLEPHWHPAIDKATD